MPDEAPNANDLVKLADLDWPWKAEEHAGSIILVSDEQFTNLADRPDEAVEKPAPWVEKPVSLRQYCQELAQNGGTKIHIAYDYFFGGSTRSLYPDTSEFQEAMKKIHDVAREYGLGIEPSILSPLELGVGYRASTGESGRWMQYGEGLRDPLTGRYSLEVWQHIQWVNNKGPTPVELVEVRVFAFRESWIPSTSYFAVDRRDIIELPPPQTEEYPGTSPIHYGAPEVGLVEGRRFQAHRLRIFGEGPVPGMDDSTSFDRVLVVLVYKTVEMDYFSPSADQFVTDLVRQYHARGIDLAGVYADEMHIQQDWIYHHHLDQGQFTVRYVSPGFEQAFAARFGAQYADLAPWLVYFTCNQHSFLATHEPKLPSQHVFGPAEGDIQATWLFRRNYYHSLEDQVVRLMISGRDELEKLQGTALDAFYHATWAESPTCDVWTVGEVQKDWSPEEHRRKYEYTPEFLWSNTIQQASAACANYFAWNEFLTGGNNDVPEGGYADRNYYGRSLACSLGALNRQPLASCGMWGMPGPVASRMAAVSAAYGAGGHPIYRSVADYAPRQVETLFLYPQDLFSIEERFGSWMAQYGYANLITAEKLVEYGRCTGDGWLEVKGKGRLISRYRAVCAQFEPFPSRALFDLLEQFVRQGGVVIWSGIPPQRWLDGSPFEPSVLQGLFGTSLTGEAGITGQSWPGRVVRFGGRFSGLEPIPVLTDFLVDRVYPLQLEAGVEAVATLRPGGGTAPVCVGALKEYPGGGLAVYLGFRPRDDQSASVGLETRAWFEILHACGAYPASRRFAFNDNPVVFSRTTPYLACEFPNGAVAVAPHYRTHEENWSGGFFRREDADAQALAVNPVAEDTIDLENAQIAGQEITYHGRHCVTWRSSYSSKNGSSNGSGVDGRLVAFAGMSTSGIILDGKEFRFAEQPVDLAWHPLYPEQATPDYFPLARVWCGSLGRVTIPLGLEAGRLQVWLGAEIARERKRRGRPQKDALRPGYGAEQVPFHLENGRLLLEIDDLLQDHWLYVVLRK